MVFSKKGVATGLATGLLFLMGALISPAYAGLISETEVDATHWGWASIYEEDGDDDVAAYILWGMAVAVLWPDSHNGGDIVPPRGGDDVPEANTLALVGMGALYLLALRRRQK